MTKSNITSDGIVEIILYSSKNERIPLTSTYNEINLYEDIYSNFVSGNLSLIDTAGILPKFEVIGYETLTIKIRANNKVVTLDFFVYSITNRVSVNESSNYYLLNFLSYESILDSRMAVSERFDGSYSEMATELFKRYESKKSLQTTTETSKTSFIAPLWHPSKTFNTFAQRAISDSGTCDFFFFETIFDGFRFASLSALRESQNDSVKTYNYTIMNAGQSDDTSNIRDYEIIQSFDSLTNTLKGGVASHGYFIDINKKSVIDQSFSYNEYKSDTTYIPKTDLTNKSPSDIPDSYQIVGYESSGLYDGSLNTKTQFPENWQQKRIAELANYQNVCLRLTLFGDITLKAGDTIKVNIPQGAIPTQNNNPLDEVISGKFYITSIRQMINKNLHYSCVEVSKAVPDTKLKNIG
jgi:hypothetical protein